MAKTNKVKAILFDMDGVLVDTEPLLCEAVINALKKQNIRLTERDYYDHWTKDGKGIKDFISERKIDVDIPKYRGDKEQYYFSLIERSLRLMPGAFEKVNELSQKYKLGLVSSSNRKMIHTIIDKIKLKKYFSVIIADEDVEKAKPAPDGFLLAAKTLGLSNKDCIVIEDAEKGVTAAKQAGMKVIAVPNKYTLNNDFSKADAILKNMSKLGINLIESLFL